MAIVDPFDAPGAPAGTIVDPFEKKTDTAPAWGDVPLEAAKHFLPDVYDIGAGLVKHAAGALTTAAPYARYGLGAPTMMAADAARAVYNDPSIVTKLPKAIWNDLVDSYGSEEALRRTLANHPAKVAMDVAAIYGGVSAVTGRVGEISRAADVSRPFWDVPKEPPGPPTPPPLPPPPAQAAVERINEAGIPLAMPRAITSEFPGVKAGAQALSVMPIVGTPLREAVQAVPAQLGKGLESLAEKYSPKLPENVVGGGIEQTLSDAAEREAAAATARAEADLAARRTAWEKENQAREQAIRDQQAQATAAAERTFGDVHPMEMAQDTINDVQSAHREARTRRDAAYADVNALDARVQQSAFSDLGQRGRQALSEAGFDIDNPGSNAANMLSELDRLSGRPGEAPANVPARMQQALEREYGGNVPASVYEQLGFPGASEGVPPDFRMLGAHAPAPGANAISVQGLEHLIKRIGKMGMNAQTPEDRAASRLIKNAVDEWRNDALTTHLTADSEAGAGAVIDAARASHRDLMERFGYNYRRLPEGEPRRAAKLLNQIVTEGVGPEALRDNLIGAKPGNRAVSAPLFEAISNAVPNAADFRGRLRGAYWNAVSDGSPATITSRVEGLTPTRMGSHLFAPHEHDLMRGFAQLARDTPEQLKQAARVAKQNEPKLIEPQPGRAQQTAKEVLGRNRSDERVFAKLDSDMREGGNIKSAARAWGQMSEANRNEFRGAWLRNLAGGGEDFNVATFNKNWPAYADQAKTFMLGREHRALLQDFHDATTNYADTIRKYGNPSGTAQVQAWHKLATGAIKYGSAALATGIAPFHPIGVAIGGLGLRKLASFLATPQGTAQVMRWNRLAEAYKRAPNPRTLYLLSAATRNLNNQ